MIALRDIQDHEENDWILRAQRLNALLTALPVVSTARISC